MKSTGYALQRNPFFFVVSTKCQPTIKESVIDLAIDQQLSNFAQTTTGVNNSPTLTKRALKTSVGLQDGDLIVLGGLTENKESDTRDGPGFLPRFPLCVVALLGVGVSDKPLGEHGYFLWLRRWVLAFHVENIQGLEYRWAIGLAAVWSFWNEVLVY